MRQLSSTRPQVTRGGGGVNFTLPPLTLIAQTLTELFLRLVSNDHTCLWGQLPPTVGGVCVLGCGWGGALSQLMVDYTWQVC